MTIRRVKRTLADSIKKLAAEKQLFSRNPGKDNTRNRKLPFEKVVAAILSFQGGTLNRELMVFFDLNSASPTTSAFVQQRAKILPAAFESLFHHFTDRICEQKTYNGYRLFAVDGSDLQIAANPQDADSFYPGANGQKSYNLLHINAMYDLLQHIYVDAIIQKSRKTDESAALTSMVDRSADKNVLLLADRGYEAYNNLAHIQEKGWSFLIRIKDSSAGIASGLNLPRSNTFDIPFHLKLTNKQTSEVKCLLLDKNHYKRIPSKCRFDYLPAKSRKADPTQFFDLHFRIVRFPISETACETIITNLGIPIIIAPKPAVSSSATQSFEKERNSSALFAREINLVTQPSFDCEQGINSQVQTVCSNADAVFPVLGIVFCKNERFSLLRKTHVPLWNAPRISHVRLP